MRLHRVRYEPMPSEFSALAHYNAEVGRGIVHAAEWQARMAESQVRFDEWQRKVYGDISVVSPPGPGRAEGGG